MKRIFFAFIILVLPVCVKSQNCFGEFNNSVSALACVDAQATFDMNYRASIIIHPYQDRYAFYQNEVNYPVKSWYITDEKYYNINEYGFKNEALDIIVVYQVIHQTNKVEIAIMLDGLPFYHGILDLSFKHEWIDISGSSTFTGQPIPFLVSFKNDKILGVAVGKITIVQHNNN
jgi:hypothetical protein